MNSPSQQGVGKGHGRNLTQILTLAVILVLYSRAFPYSVLTHEEIVDLVWLDEIRPLLLKRFPLTTEDQMKEAHAYAYGGAVIQDLGYYPFGSKEFSDLTHYVRSGDFVRELLRESEDVNEFAFALGALAHYSSDISGHPTVNHAVALEYPRLRAKYGDSVRYAQNKTAHLKVEFGFDTVQVAKNRYAPQQYHDFIGFQVSKPLLERAFPVVYGMELKDVIPSEDLAIGTYRFAVSKVIPQVTQVALRANKKALKREYPDFAKQKFLYRLSRSDYEREWGRTYQRPGLGVRILATIFRVIPKIGPFKALAFNSPTVRTEDMYFKSINLTVDQYRSLLHEVGNHSLRTENCDLDDGKSTEPGEYSLADETYAKLLQQLSARQFNEVTPELRKNITDFYSNRSSLSDTKRKPDEWRNLEKELQQLKAANLQQVSPSLVTVSGRQSEPSSAEPLATTCESSR